MRLANAVADAVAVYSKSLASGNGYQMDHFRSTSLPQTPVGPGPILFGFAGGLLALLIAVFVVVVVGEAQQEEVLFVARPVDGAEPVGNGAEPHGKTAPARPRRASAWKTPLR